MFKRFVDKNNEKTLMFDLIAAFLYVFTPEASRRGQ